MSPRNVKTPDLRKPVLVLLAGMAGFALTGPIGCKKNSILNPATFDFRVVVQSSVGIVVGTPRFLPVTLNVPTEIQDRVVVQSLQPSIATAVAASTAGIEITCHSVGSTVILVGAEKSGATIEPAEVAVECFPRVPALNEIPGSYDFEARIQTDAPSCPGAPPTVRGENVPIETFSSEGRQFIRVKSSSTVEGEVVPEFFQDGFWEGIGKRETAEGSEIEAVQGCFRNFTDEQERLLRELNALVKLIRITAAGEEVCSSQYQVNYVERPAVPAFVEDESGFQTCP